MKNKLIPVIVIITLLWQNLLWADMLRPRAMDERSDLPPHLFSFVEQIRVLSEYFEIDALAQRTATPYDIITRRYYRIHPFHIFPMPRKDYMEEWRRLRRQMKDLEARWWSNFIVKVPDASGVQHDVGIQDFAQINRYLVPQGLVFYIRSYKGRLCCLLGRIKEHAVVSGVDVFLVDEELVCNEDMGIPGVCSPEYKMIILRQKAEEYCLWMLITVIRVRGKKGLIMEPEHTLFKLGLRALAGITEQELFESDPALLVQRIREATVISLKGGTLGHEFGHFDQLHAVFKSGINIARANNDRELESFIHELDEFLADIDMYRLSIKQEEPFRFGNLCLKLAYNICLPSRVDFVFQRDFITAFLKYVKTGDIRYFSEAVDRTSEVFKSYLGYLKENATYQEWLHFMERLKKEFPLEPKAAALRQEELYELHYADIAPNILKHLPNIFNLKQIEEPLRCI